ncbi:nuclear transport factor 2 family protein [Allokutzneria oryzae]|uniref:Nuclear transport factor 2 family protein n=1 Tax=Allokutzneria oryzae TaxID=1378989 RepID=A0ABV6A1B8_9PSEU
MTDNLAERLDRVESELAIQRLVHEYCHGADKQDLRRFTAIWHEDAVWAPSPDQRFNGIDAIRAGVKAQWQSFQQMHHWTANLVVDFDGDRASGEADTELSVQLIDGTWIRGGGTYRDVYTRRNGIWRIIYREVSSSFDIDRLPPGIGSPVT